MEHITANNETKWASSFIPYSQFVLHRKLVTDHPKHSLGSEVIIPRISGWEEFHLEAPTCLQISLSTYACQGSIGTFLLCSVLRERDCCQVPSSPTPHCHPHQQHPQSWLLGTAEHLLQHTAEQGSQQEAMHLTQVTASQRSFRKWGSSSIKKVVWVNQNFVNSQSCFCTQI